MSKTKFKATITIPRPVSEITDDWCTIVTNEGDLYSPYDYWLDFYTEEELAKMSEQDKLFIINQEFIGELENGFVFRTEEDAKEFLNAMRYVIR